MEEKEQVVYKFIRDKYKNESKNFLLLKIGDKQNSILNLQQENTNLKMQIDKLIKKYEEAIKDKLDEIINEYNLILDNHKEDLNYISICTHQYNAMRKVLEELLEQAFI